MTMSAIDQALARAEKITENPLVIENTYLPQVGDNVFVNQEMSYEEVSDEIETGRYLKLEATSNQMYFNSSKVESEKSKKIIVTFNPKYDISVYDSIKAFNGTTYVVEKTASVSRTPDGVLVPNSKRITTSGITFADAITKIQSLSSSAKVEKSLDINFKVVEFKDAKGLDIMPLGSKLVFVTNKSATASFGTFMSELKAKGLLGEKDIKLSIEVKTIKNIGTYAVPVFTLITE